MNVRTTLPAADNKYYLKIPAGWNPCILGNPKNRLYPDSVLSNCVGWAVARYNEICRSNGCGRLGNRNPGGFITLAKQQGLEIGASPKPGCCVVLVKENGSDGHVQIVEKISGGKYYISESGWSYAKGHYMTNRWVTKAGNFGMSKEYHFQGCIYNPCVDPYDIPPDSFSTYKTSKGPYVKFVQWVLNKEKCYAAGADSKIDGIAGAATKQAIMNYQRKHALAVDGYAGPKTVGQMKKDWAII